MEILLGIKCSDCGSYNTVREKGGLVRKLHGKLVEESFEPDDHDDTRFEVAGGGSLTPPETPTRDPSLHSSSSRAFGTPGTILGVIYLCPRTSLVSSGTLQGLLLIS